MRSPTATTRSSSRSSPTASTGRWRTCHISGDFSANAAWVVLAAMTQNILRAVGALASMFHAKARCATLRRDLINVPAATARTGRAALTLRGIAGWHTADACLNLHAAIRPGARGPTTAAA